jgi:hypothetical protein
LTPSALTTYGCGAQVFFGGRRYANFAMFFIGYVAHIAVIGAGGDE